MDEELRRLQRLAADGDLLAIERYKAALRRLGHWDTLIALALFENDPDQALEALSRIAPELRDDAAMKAGWEVAQKTGIWHGLLLLDAETHQFLLDADRNGYWHEDQQNRDDIDLCRHLYTFSDPDHPLKDLWVEFNIGEGPYSVTWDGDEVNWGIEPPKGGLLGTMELLNKDDFYLAGGITQVMLTVGVAV